MTSTVGTEDDTFRKLCKKTEGELVEGLLRLEASSEFKSGDYVDRHTKICEFITNSGWDVTEFENKGYRNFLSSLLWSK